MLLRYVLPLIFVLNSFYGRGQTIVTGTVTEKNGEVVPGATIKVLNPDSSLLTGTLSDEGGKFEMSLESGRNYIVAISSISFKTFYRKIAVTIEPVLLGQVILREDAQTLSEVEVKTLQDRGQQKGDTTQFNADAFKTNPDANAEDLLKKMPGISRDNEGMKVNGEKVQKVLVDGKPFFGDDPDAALKNLPAEVIDKVEVFDKMSDQAQFTGFDDGNEQKTINIVTKKGKNIGEFGRVYAGAGADESMDTRYNAGGAVNFFNDKRRVSLLFLSNNVNQQNFSLADISGATGTSPSGGRGASRRNSALMSPTQDGISATNAAGFNYSDMWGKKIEVSGSYFFNRSDNRKSSDVVRNYFTENNLVYREESSDRYININHRINLRFEYAIDSASKLTVVPSLNLQDNNNTSFLSGSNNIFDNVLLSQTNSNSNNNNLTYNLSNYILYQYKFRKKGRSVSLRLRNQQNEKKLAGSNSSVNEFNDSSDVSTFLDQVTKTYSNNREISGNIAYTEPLNKNAQIQVNYEPSYAESTSDKGTNDYDPLRNEHSSFNPALSNKYENIYQTQRAGVSFRYHKDKLNFNLGTDAQESVLSGQQTFPYDFKLSQSFKNVLPNARLHYKISKARNLRINYRSRTSIPDISQLQEVIDISNPLQARTGNASLRQTFENSIYIRYGGFNTQTSRNLMLFLNLSKTDNYISNATYILHRDSVIQGFNVRSGSQLTRPVNLNGYYSTRFYFVYGFPLPAIKSNLNFNGGANYNRSPALINNIFNLSNSYATNAGVFIGSNISENIDFSLGYAANYTFVKNTELQVSDNSFVSQNTTFKFNWIFLKGFVLNTDIIYTSYTGLNQSFNQNFLLWNAGFGYKFLKNRSLEARISVFDILNQNRSIGRTVTGAYTEDYNTIALRRYGLFSLVYTFKKFRSGGMPDQPKMDGFDNNRHERGGR
jgi:hypothetical protein